MDRLAVELNRDSSIPMYEQLYAHIKAEITEGRLLFQTKLPSKRRLADVLRISLNTVETAYEQLTAEGYLEVIPRKGYFVMASEDLEYIGAKSTLHLQTNQQTNSITIDFHPSQIDTENFPFQQWRKYAKNSMQEDHHEWLLLGDSRGEIELRHEIAVYLYHARGVKCSPDQIIVGAGIEILLQQLVLLLNPTTIYGVEDPGYHLIQQILTCYNHQVYPLAVDEEGLIVKNVESSPINIVYVTPSHHFPYGTVLSVNRRTQLLNWASGHTDRFIIEDDYDSEFRYTGKAIPSLQSLDHTEKVIYLGSFSKSLMPSIRISYMVLPKQLLTRHQQELSFYHSTVSRIDQHILTEFMRMGDFEKHLNRMRKLYRRKLEMVLASIKPYSSTITIIGEQSGLHVVLAVNNGMTEDTLVTKAAAAGVKIYPVSLYSMAEQNLPHPQIILGFAGIPETKLTESLNVLLGSWGFNRK